MYIDFVKKQFDLAINCLFLLILFFILHSYWKKLFFKELLEDFT